MNIYDFRFKFPHHDRPPLIVILEALIHELLSYQLPHQVPPLGRHATHAAMAKGTSTIEDLPHQPRAQIIADQRSVAGDRQ